MKSRWTREQPGNVRYEATTPRWTREQPDYICYESMKSRLTLDQVDHIRYDSIKPRLIREQPDYFRYESTEFLLTPEQLDHIRYESMKSRLTREQPDGSLAAAKRFGAPRAPVGVARALFVAVGFSAEFSVCPVLGEDPALPRTPQCEASVIAGVGRGTLAVSTPFLRSGYSVRLHAVLPQKL